MNLRCIANTRHSNPDKTAPRSQRSNLVVGLFTALTVLGGCQNMSLWSDDRQYREQVQLPFEAGMSQISQYYVHEVDREKFAFDSLAAISEVDPALRILDEGGKLALTVNGEVMERFEKPATGSPTLWARFASGILAEARDLSPRLGQLANDEILALILNGGLKGIDRYSRYYSPREASRVVREREGYNGIGVEIDQVEGEFLIIHTVPNSPAEKAGITPGSRLLSINGEKLTGKALEFVRQRMEGPKGSHVTLSISQPGSDWQRSLKLQRNRLLPESVFLTVKGDIPTIQISVFNAMTARSFESLITENIGTGEEKWRGLILDLRGNPGGLLDQAVEVADLMLDGGQIVAASGRHYASRKRFLASRGDILHGIPITVLVDGATASAAEILAASLQDNQRAVIVGSISYGKGAVQIVRSLPNKGELDLTWAYYKTAGKYPINNYGILPTICTVGYDNGIAAVLVPLRKRAQSTRESFLRLRRLQYEDDSRVEAFRRSCSWQADSSRELELEAAHTLLNDANLYHDALLLAAADIQG